MIMKEIDPISPCFILRRIRDRRINLRLMEGSEIATYGLDDRDFTPVSAAYDDEDKSTNN